MDDRINRVLVCPLGWGLGHASRIIPIIARFQKSGFEVIAAGDELQMQYISTYYPTIKTIIFPSFNVRLASGSSQLVPILGIAFRLPYHIIKEHFALRNVVRENRINLIISDNRYGLWCKGIRSVLITHQLRVLFPKPLRFKEPAGMWLIRLFSQRFTFCWIPDFPDDKNLAGRLSHPAKLPSNARYTGLLSRFQGLTVETDSQQWDMVGIASGPSPQREIFIGLIGALAKRNNLKAIIIKGNPKEGTNIIENDGVFYAGHLNDIDFLKIVKYTKYLITRAGYSTIMDLAAIGVSGLIVPTPGQTEQEYLAEYLSFKGLFKTCTQRELEKINISIALSLSIQTNNSNELFEKVVQELMAKLNP